MDADGLKKPRTTGAEGIMAGSSYSDLAGSSLEFETDKFIRKNWIQVSSTHVNI